MMLATCANCGGRLAPRYGKIRDADSGELFDVLYCDSCGLGHTAPVPADLGRYYTAIYHGNRHGATDRYCVRRRMRFLRSAAADKQAGRLLDVGCGEGTFLLAARAAGWKVMGTELAPVRARGSGLEVVETLEQAAAGAPFDAITMWHSLEHLAAPARVLSEACKLLAPEGILLVAVPNAGGVQARIFRRHWLHLDVPRHLHHFSRKALEGMLRRSGFVVEQVWNQEIEYDLMGWTQSALNAALPHPNTLFQMLTGKAARAKTWEKGTSLAGGALLAAPALTATWLTAACGGGGTLVIAARKLRAVKAA